MPIRTVARPPAGNVAFAPTTQPTYRGGGGFNVRAKVGTFNSRTTLGSQSVTGIGFRPKAVLPFTAYQTGNGNVTGASLSLGCADSDAQAAIGVVSGNGVTTSSTGRSHSATDFVNHFASAVAASPHLRASRTSFDSDGFTLNWSLVDPTVRVINHICLGGSKLEANLVPCQMNGTNAAQSFAHGLSGTPTAVLFFCPITSAAAPTTQLGLISSIGAWANGSQFGASIYSQNAVTTTVSRRVLSSSHVLANIDTAVTRSMAVSSVDSTNVNVTYPVTAFSGQLHFYMLCLRGCRAQVGTFDYNDSLDPLAIACPGIIPRLFMPIFIWQGVSSIGSILTNAMMSIGASDGTTTVSCGISDTNSVTTTETRRHQSSLSLAEYSLAGGFRSEASVSFSGQSVIVDPSTINIVADYGQGGYLIIGE